MTHGLTEQDLASLSPAEREALEAEPSDTESALEAGAPGVEAPKEDPKDAPKAEADPLTDPPKTEVVTDEATEPEEPPKEDPPAKPERDALAVPYQARAVDPEKVRAELSSLKEKFDAGELTMDAYLDQRDAITAAALKAQIAAEHNAQVAVERWKDTVDRFLEDHPEYVKGSVRYKALDAQIKSMDGPEYEGLSHRQLIQKAHELLEAEIGSAKAKDEPKKPEDPKKALAEKRKPDLSAVPTTLAGVPPAAPQNADTDEFSQIDSLQARAAAGDTEAQIALEWAIKRMTPEQQDRWARAA